MNKNFIFRLIKYKRVLSQLRTLGLERVFSNNLGDATGVAAALVRKDLARIGMHGNRRGGYNIVVMLELVNANLGGTESREAIVVGCGNLGRALLNNESFHRDGIELISGFDINPPAAHIGGIPVYSMEKLHEIIQTKHVKIALLTVPSSAAAEVRDRLLANGIRGILNFTSTELSSTDNCIIKNVNISLELESLFFSVHVQAVQHGMESSQKPDTRILREEPNP